MTPQARVDLRDRIFGRLNLWDRAALYGARHPASPEWMWTLPCGLLTGHNDIYESGYSDIDGVVYANCMNCGKSFSLAGVEA
jgi:hypothetical protein